MLTKCVVAANMSTVLFSLRLNEIHNLFFILYPFTVLSITTISVELYDG
jgi:hypothetical protein